MRTILAVATVLSIGTAATTLSDYGTARATYGGAATLVQPSDSSPNGRGIVLAEGEGNRPSPGSRDASM